ncbi:hypothetical protein CDD83_7889 [Cordyceps sp. RAO-2017]|nr:hypothetical protein CDD83_7889 [Cordyceps sp. RAO-2017]
MMPAARAIGAGTGRRVLVHVISGIGGLSYAATLAAYREAYGLPLRHHLVVMDSAPTCLRLTATSLWPWARALTVSAAGRFPWPDGLTQALFILLLLVDCLYRALLRRPAVGTWGLQTIDRETPGVTAPRRLHMYSKEDRLTHWQDIESHAANWRARGAHADMELFAGSDHVMHMIHAPEQYWGAVGRAWRKATGPS